MLDSWMKMGRRWWRGTWKRRQMPLPSERPALLGESIAVAEPSNTHTQPHRCRFRRLLRWSSLNRDTRTKLSHDHRYRLL